MRLDGSHGRRRISARGDRAVAVAAAYYPARRRLAGSGAAHRAERLVCHQTDEEGRKGDTAGDVDWWSGHLMQNAVGSKTDSISLLIGLNMNVRSPGANGIEQYFIDEFYYRSFVSSTGFLFWAVNGQNFDIQFD